MNDPWKPLHDEVAATVGAALGRWGGVENHLSYLFSAISDIENNKAYLVFSSIISFDARLAVCATLVGSEEDDEGRAVWAKLNSRILKYYRKRHELAHFTFVADESKDGIPRVSVSPFWSLASEIRENRKELSAAEITERSRKFTELADALGWFQARALHRRGVKTANYEPFPELIERFREQVAQGAVDAPA